MSKQVDKLKKVKYKSYRLIGESVKGSLLEAGYSEGHARRSTANKIVKDSEKELIDSFNSKNITVDWVIEQLTNELTAPDCKASDRIRVKELLGKYLNMFKDTANTQLMLNINETIDKLRQPIPIDITTSNSKG